jgi:hypothetical protein
MESSVVQVFLTILLLLSLFLSDSWILGNAYDESNAVLYTLLIIIFVLFLLESVILSFVQDHYFLSFFFWMDVIGTLSIILDIGWIANEFMPDNTTATSKGSLLRAARAAKLGARYGRLMRLMKIFKFIHILPCFKKDDIHEEAEPTMSAVRKVSNKLSEVLSRRVAALVMILVIVVPFLNYNTTDYSVNAWLSNYADEIINPNVTVTTLNTMTTEFYDFYKDKDLRPIRIILESPYLDTTYSQEFSWGYEIRSSNKLAYIGSRRVNDQRYYIKIIMNNTIINMWGSLFGILLIILVIASLVGFSASFQNSVDELVVLPLEKMMTTLRYIYCIKYIHTLYTYMHTN